MIIVSQDKKNIINSETINFIDIMPIADGSFEIDANFAHCITELGYYGTEERAKEVLQEIVDEYIKYATIENEIGSVKEVTILPKKYEMPKE